MRSPPARRTCSSTTTAAAGYSGRSPGDQTYGTGFTDFDGGQRRGHPLVDAADAVRRPRGVGRHRRLPRGSRHHRRRQRRHSFERAGGTATPTTTPRTSDGARRRAIRQNRAAPPPPPGDQAPRLTSTDPADGDERRRRATRTSRVTFSEPVDAASGAFSFTLRRRRPSPFTVTTPPTGTTFMLDPDGRPARGADCTRHRSTAAACRDPRHRRPAGQHGRRLHAHASARPASRACGSTTSRAASTSRRYAGTLVAGVPGVITARAHERLLHAGPAARRRRAHLRGHLRLHRRRAGRRRWRRATPSRSAGGDRVPRPAAPATRANLTTTEITAPAVTPSRHRHDRADRRRQRRPRAADQVIDDDTVDPRRRPAADHRRRRDQSLVLFQDPTSTRQDGIDFYESLEGMLTAGQRRRSPSGRRRLRRDPRCSPTAAPARQPHARGGIVAARPTSRRRRSTAAATSTPSGSILDDVIAGPTPRSRDIGDRFAGAGPRRASTTRSATSSSWSRDWPAARRRRAAAARPPRAPGRDELTVASYNVENLDPADGRRIRRHRPPDHRDNLRSPGHRR